MWGPACGGRGGHRYVICAAGSLQDLEMSAVQREHINRMVCRICLHAVWASGADHHAGMMCEGEGAGKTSRRPD